MIRLTKLAFEEAGISMPDEAREVIFPAGVPVQMLAEERRVTSRSESREHSHTEAESTAHSAEGNLASEAADIKQQADKSRTPEAGQNLLDS